MAEEKNAERLARLALYLGLNTNQTAFHRVMRHLGSAIDALAGHDLSHVGVNVTPLMAGGLMEEALDHLNYAREGGLDIIIWGDDHYPVRLAEIPDPPPVLWLHGELTDDDRFAVALVGSRRASSDGLAAARRLGREGAECGLTVVSGLAKGVDAQAHRGALEAGGRTLAVLGCGLNHVYPRENAGLYREIAHRGALISEFPPDVGPLGANFPRRNRVIAGLGLATVVVEASERSGALITARLAAELGREVAAVPGRAGSDYAKGAHRLIKNGAALIESMKDVVLEIRPRLLEGILAPEPGRAVPPLPDNEPDSYVKPPSRPARPRPVKAPPLPPQPEPDTPEAKILARLTGGGKDVDTLIRSTGIGAAEMAALLLNMELSGMIRRLASGLFEKL
ncbi:DNA-protecting protein DprA [Deltaproteobacteria bacterium Smac51]|nr:DNA-protecting protein DprA [Deltaproteobacteria bacterium Smac51]